MIKVYLSLLALLYSSNAFSWGLKGHKIIVSVAQSRLKPNIIDSVNRYLDIISWKDAACWMDMVSEERGYEFMTPWHNIYFPQDKTYVDAKAPNLVDELEFVITALKNRKKYPREKIAMYLKILMNLMGEIHEPLHCGYPEDNGGSDRMIKFNDELTSLRKGWDSEIIIQKNIREKDCNRLIKAWKPDQIDQIKKASVLDCLNESRALLPQVYSAKKKISGKYIIAAKATITQQLTKAALRLQARLEDIFSTN